MREKEGEREGKKTTYIYIYRERDRRGMRERIEEHKPSEEVCEIVCDVFSSTFLCFVFRPV